MKKSDKISGKAKASPANGQLESFKREARVFGFTIEKPLSKLYITLAMLLYVAIIYVLPISCPISELLGVPCPGCGLTRAVFSAARLDFSAAFEYHPMFFTLPVIYALILTDGKLFQKKAANIALCFLLLAGFLICWLYRLFVFNSLS